MEKLQEKAQELFSTHHALDIVFIATDGTGYGSKMEAQGHASQLASNAVFEFRRGTLEGALVSGAILEPTAAEEANDNTGSVADGEKVATAKEVIAKIKEATTVEQVDTLMVGEERKSVLEAGEAKIKQLNAPAE